MTLLYSCPFIYDLKRDKGIRRTGQALVLDTLAGTFSLIPDVVCPPLFKESRSYSPQPKNNYEHKGVRYGGQDKRP
jgi:hypothetical protein